MEIKQVIIQANQFSSYTDTSVTINDQSYSSSMAVTNNEIFKLDINNMQSLVLDDLAKILTPNLDLIIFGSKNKIVYPPKDLVKALHAKSIGVEAMSITSLCRTFNFLVSEGRNIAGVLIF